MPLVDFFLEVLQSLVEAGLLLTQLLQGGFLVDPREVYVPFDQLELRLGSAHVVLELMEPVLVLLEEHKPDEHADEAEADGASGDEGGPKPG